ncbi:hypothetical protein ACPWSR_13675 [Alloiococcus sp. CFN-8]|uniref:hypothetical protein n=1 Tax=Alloiococcus sp. CFN-8 TaxID=3416081 RepID=UPI003CE9B0EC
MDKYEKYRKIRGRLELVAFMIAFIVGNSIASYFGLTGKKFFSLDTGMNFAIVLGLTLVLSFFAVRIADKWYEKNKYE